MNMKKAKIRTTVILFLAMSFISKSAIADNQNPACDDYHASLDIIIENIRLGRFKIVNDIAKGADILHPCIRYLTFIANISHFENKMISTVDIKNNYKTSACATLFSQLRCEGAYVAKERLIFKKLSKGCESFLSEIKLKVEQRRKPQIFAKRMSAGLWASAGVTFVAATALGLSSRYSGTCYSKQNLPSQSDGKDLLCVYPANYNIGVPILVAAGLSFTIGGVVELAKAKKIESVIGAQESDVIDVTCPSPLPDDDDTVNRAPETAPPKEVKP